MTIHSISFAIMKEKYSHISIKERSSKILYLNLALTKGALWLNDNALENLAMKKFIEDKNTEFDLVVVCPFFASEAGYYLAHRWNASLGIYFSGEVTAC